MTSRLDVARMRQTWLSSPDQGGIFKLHYQDFFPLCVAIHSHIRPLTHTPLTLTLISHKTQMHKYTHYTGSKVFRDKEIDACYGWEFSYSDALEVCE